VRISLLALAQSTDYRTETESATATVWVLPWNAGMAGPGITRQVFELKVDGGEKVPAILQHPRTSGACPAVLLLHGFNSRKERMADSIGRELLRRSIASLAIDLPMHGARDGDLENLSLRNPIALVQSWRLALGEAHGALAYLADQRSIDAHRVALVGYSLGAYIGVIVAADDPHVNALVLAAGGDLPEQTPFASLVRTIADPRKAVRNLAGRPLLMVNGKFDRVVTPAQARALFEAAREPKAIRWYDGGHWPSAPMISETSEWLAEQLAAPRAQSRPA